jgi:hypothetical protein
MFRTGFLGYPTTFMLDFVVCALVLIVPLLLFSLWLVKFRRNYAGHMKLPSGGRDGLRSRRAIGTRWLGKHCRSAEAAGSRIRRKNLCGPTVAHSASGVRDHDSCSVGRYHRSGSETIWQESSTRSTQSSSLAPWVGLDNRYYADVRDGPVVLLHGFCPIVSG